MATEAPVGSIDTKHADTIHDAQMDYFGKRLATCSSDRTIRIFDVEDDGRHSLVQELRGHEGPVWMVAWAHPSFGSMLASCSHDHKVIIWKETAAGWEKFKEYGMTSDEHASSVNSVAWAPYSLGYPMLACASADGDISVLSYKDSKWSPDKIVSAHKGGVNAVSWAPLLSVGPLGQAAEDDAPRVAPRLISCGCDDELKIWNFREDEVNGGWRASQMPTPVLKDMRYSGWYRDVAWAPSIGLSSSTIACCTQNGEVLIWTQHSSDSEAWSCVELPTRQADLSAEPGPAEPVWRVSWSLTGNLLAVSSGESNVTLYKEQLDSQRSAVAGRDATHDTPAISSWKIVGEVGGP
eukprot:m.27356 g.27356  ORF g.27356 m.27356 type:complete len:351 (+) comp11908_c0_seq1:107-1159(+)